MKAFLTKLVLLIFITSILLSAIAIVSDNGLRETKHDNYVVWNELYAGNINADIIILGSSRAWVHVSPSILDSILNVNSYNLGLDGQNFIMQSCIYEAYLQHNINPKIIIHCLDVTSLTDQSELFNLEQTLPYLNDSIVSKKTKQHEGYAWVDYYNPFSKYLFRREALWLGISESLGLIEHNSAKYKGYQGKDDVWDGKFELFIESNPEGLHLKLDSNVRNLFEEYLVRNIKQRIQPVLVFPPELKENQVFIENRDSILNVYTMLAKKHSLSFLDYSDDAICYNRKYFYNSSHLNRSGAEIFTTKLSRDLQKAIDID